MKLTAVILAIAAIAVSGLLAGGAVASRVRWRTAPCKPLPPSYARTFVLCNGSGRMIFRVPHYDDSQSEAVTGWRQFADRRSGAVGYRVQQYNKGGDGRLLAEDGLRFATSDGGRHWLPTQLRRREPGGEWHSLPARPCVWHNPTQRYKITHKPDGQAVNRPIPTRFGYTCFPRASFAYGGN
jgi:hypothetical protein